MSDRKINLRSREYDQIAIKYPPLIACSSNGSVFLYASAKGALCLYISATDDNIQLPPSPFVTSRISSIAISPAHTMCVSCYEDGSINLYDLIENKTLRSFPKEIKSKITHCIFVNDDELVTFDDKFNLMLLTFKKVTLFKNNTLVTMTKSKLQLENSPFKMFANQLIVPPVYRAINNVPENLTENAFCTAPKYGQLIGLALFKKVIIAEIKPKFRVVYEIPKIDENDPKIDCEKPVIAFTLPNPDILYLAYATTLTINVVRITKINKNISNNNNNNNVNSKKNHYDDGEELDKAFNEMATALDKFSFEGFLDSLVDNSNESSNKTKIDINVSEEEEEKKRKAHMFENYYSNEYESNLIYTKPIQSPAKFVTFLSSSLVGVIGEGNVINMFPFLEPEKMDSFTVLEKTKGILINDNGSIVVMNAKGLYSYYLFSFYSNFTSLKADKMYIEIFELCKKAINNDPDSIVGLPIDPEIRAIEIERLCYSVLNEYVENEIASKKVSKKGQLNKSENKNLNENDSNINNDNNENNNNNGNNVKDKVDNVFNVNYLIENEDDHSIQTFAKNIVRLVVEIKNREWITREGLALFKEKKGALYLIREILSNDQEGKLFSYTSNFISNIIRFQDEVNDIIDLPKFLIGLPPRIAKPKMILRYALDRHDIEMCIKVLAEKMNEPKKALDLIESVGDFSTMVADLLIKRKRECSHDVIKNFECIEWLFAAAKPQISNISNNENHNNNNIHNNSDGFCFLRLKKLLMIDQTEKIKEILVWMNDVVLLTSKSSKIEADDAQQQQKHKVLNNDIYINGILMAFLELNIRCTSDLFKVLQGHIIENEGACPHCFTKSALKYIIDSIFFVDFKKPDRREEFLIKLVENQALPSTNFAISILPLCNSYSFDNAEALILERYQLYGQQLEKIIANCSAKKVLPISHVSSNGVAPIVNNRSRNISGFVNYNLSSESAFNVMKYDYSDKPYPVYENNAYDDVFNFILSKFWSNNNNNNSNNINNEIREKILFEIEKMVMKHSDRLAIANADKLIETMARIHSNILFNKLPNSIKDEKVRNYFLRRLLIIFSSEVKELELKVIDMIPFFAEFFPNDLLGILHKYSDLISTLKSQSESEEENQTYKSIIDLCEKNGLLDACAYIAAKADDKERAKELIRKMIVTNPVRYAITIYDVCIILFSPTKNIENTPNNNNINCGNVNTNVEVNENQNNINLNENKMNENNGTENNTKETNITENIENDNNIMKHKIKDFHFVAKSFVKIFSSVELSTQFDDAAVVYRNVCDAASVFTDFITALNYTQKIFGGIESAKFLRIAKYLFVKRTFSPEASQRVKDFVVAAAGEQVRLMTCARCSVKLFVEGKGVKMFRCGHAVHLTQYCSHEISQCPRCGAQC